MAAILMAATSALRAHKITEGAGTWSFHSPKASGVWVWVLGNECWSLDGVLIAQTRAKEGRFVKRSRGSGKAPNRRTATSSYKLNTFNMKITSKCLLLEAEAYCNKLLVCHHNSSCDLPLSGRDSQTPQVDGSALTCGILQVSLKKVATKQNRLHSGLQAFIDGKQTPPGVPEEGRRLTT
ncbi:hypothetical protein BDR03DRAFT_1016569 [Suillus americanus]|nr:hypothetical protein BDR03DRAFT_1016569 [Suillus americanus]